MVADRARALANDGALPDIDGCITRPRRTRQHLLLDSNGKAVI
jgi:hypothetical protein